MDVKFRVSFLVSTVFVLLAVITLSVCSVPTSNEISSSFKLNVEVKLLFLPSYFVGHFIINS